jgi:hypothetical protein
MPEHFDPAVLNAFKKASTQSEDRPRKRRVIAVS